MGSWESDSVTLVGPFQPGIFNDSINCSVFLQFMSCLDFHYAALSSCVAFFQDSPQSPQNVRKVTISINSPCQFCTVPVSEQPRQKQKLYLFPAAFHYPCTYMHISGHVKSVSIHDVQKGKKIVVNISWEITGDIF